MTPNVPEDIRGKVEAALICLNEAAYALDAYDMDKANEDLADACDVLVDIVGDYDIKVTGKHNKIINKAVDNAIKRNRNS